MPRQSRSRPRIANAATSKRTSTPPSIRSAAGRARTSTIHEIEARPTRNRRSVWTVTTNPFPEAHFATYPPALIEPCIKAGSREGGIVIDPFAGAGTSGVVALRHGRRFVGIELSAEYAAMARRRIESDAPLFNTAPAPPVVVADAEQAVLFAEPTP